MAPILTQFMLKQYVAAEFDAFLTFLWKMIDIKHHQAQGNKFSQSIHDTVTLANRKKF